jgi:hypothetical protein
MRKGQASEALLSMSSKELKRTKVMDRLEMGLLTQREAGAELMLTDRQIRRLLQLYRVFGPEGLVSRRRGLPSNRRYGDKLRQMVRDLVGRFYRDFKPGYANEYLRERHDICISKETLRLWMIEDGFWKGKRRRYSRPHQSRERRSRLGELIQVDGSHHDWFEGRGSKCVLLLFIDDATSRIMYMRFVPAETTEAYMMALRGYISRHGRPVALYADKHSIFYVSDKELRESDTLTQFGRVAKTLDVELIPAHSAPAKGRVERSFSTHQDRLIKAMRLLNINTIEAANKFLENIYQAKHNKRFAKLPADQKDAHRKVLHSTTELDLIFSCHYTRILSKSLSLQFKKTIYLIKTEGIGYALRGAKVTVCESYTGKITLLRNGKELPYKILQPGTHYSLVEDTKTINSRVDQVIAKQKSTGKWKPAPDHPWRRTPL